MKSNRNFHDQDENQDAWTLDASPGLQTLQLDPSQSLELYPDDGTDRVHVVFNPTSRINQNSAYSTSNVKKIGADVSLLPEREAGFW